MKIQSMFQKDINRDINGVVKVAQDDEKSLHQELSEYIITKELRRHFRTFFDNYTKAIDQPTDKMGVWISGFFGSGKSHFLKMLSYLLSNKEVQEVPAIDYFKDKFDDPMMYAQAVKCVSIPTESILFNIDIEGPINKDKTAVLRTFAKMFYNHCGFYGDDLKIAKLERFIDRQGKTEEFRQKFEEVNGGPWVETRDSFAFFEDDVVEVLQSVLGMSEQAARNWFNGEETNELSIAQLVSDIKEYVDSKGDKFRLLFMVDEVGQYIGDDGDLMINLQSLVEELGAKCMGKVWVMVTSQEAIDSVVKIAGDDFSKIQGRFNTRLSLSSSSVDEVIKKRVLAKTEEADQLLHMVYDKEQAVLKNLFVFNDSVLDIKGFADGGEFAATFPFVPYQFIIIQKVLAEIRKHGNSGKHLSGGERSMLSGFQEAAQKVQDLIDKLPDDAAKLDYSKDRKSVEKADAAFGKLTGKQPTFLEPSAAEKLAGCVRQMALLTDCETIVKDAQAAIKKLPAWNKIKKSDEAKVHAAEDAMQALASAAEEKHVTLTPGEANEQKYQASTEAFYAYKELAESYRKTYLAPLETLTDADEAHEAAIRTARTEYQALGKSYNGSNVSKCVQSFIEPDDLTMLKNLEKQLSQNQKAAKKVMNLIAKLPKHDAPFTKRERKAIDTAKSAYDGLSSAARSFVENVDTLNERYQQAYPTQDSGEQA